MRSPFHFLFWPRGLELIVRAFGTRREDQTDPGNGEALETYLTRYSHRPLVPPPGVKAPGAGW